MNTFRSFRARFAALAGLLLVAGCSQPHPLVGQAAPDFSLDDLSGQKVSLAQFRGQVVLLNFWAVGCGPCRMEIPHLVTLHEKYGKDGLRVIGVNAWENEPDARVKDFVTKEKLPYTILRGSRTFLGDTYKGKYIPHNFLIDRQGKVVWSEIGFDEADLPALERRIEDLLARS